MNLHITKSKNAESFYICKSYVKANGSTTSTILFRRKFIKKVLRDFGCQKFIYCSDAGLGSEAIREYNHMGERAFIVAQSIKKLKKEEKE